MMCGRVDRLGTGDLATVWTGFGQGRPAVVDDYDLDIGRHVTDVDLAGVDEPGFWGWCANRTLQPLDGEHPLWRVTLATAGRRA